jgi:hypothetical protein
LDDVRAVGRSEQGIVANGSTGGGGDGASAGGGDDVGGKRHASGGRTCFDNFTTGGSGEATVRISLTGHISMVIAVLGWVDGRLLGEGEGQKRRLAARKERPAGTLLIAAIGFIFLREMVWIMAAAVLYGKYYWYFHSPQLIFLKIIKAVAEIIKRSKIHLKPVFFLLFSR